MCATCPAHEAPHYAVFSSLPPLSPPGLNIDLSTLSSETLNVQRFLRGWN